MVSNERVVSECSAWGSVAGRQYGPASLVLASLPMFKKKMCQYSSNTYLYCPWIPVDIISGFIFPLIFCSRRSDLIALSFEILMISSRCLSDSFLDSWYLTPNSTRHPAATKILPCLILPLSSKGIWYPRGSKIFPSSYWSFGSSCLFGVLS